MRSFPRELGFDEQKSVQVNKMISNGGHCTWKLCNVFSRVIWNI